MFKANLVVSSFVVFCVLVVLRLATPAVAQTTERTIDQGGTGSSAPELSHQPAKTGGANDAAMRAHAGAAGNVDLKLIDTGAQVPDSFGPSPSLIDTDVQEFQKRALVDAVRAVAARHVAIGNTTSAEFAAMKVRPQSCRERFEALGLPGKGGEGFSATKRLDQYRTLEIFVNPYEPNRLRVYLKDSRVHTAWGESGDLIVDHRADGSDKGGPMNDCSLFMRILLALNTPDIVPSDHDLAGAGGATFNATAVLALSETNGRSAGRAGGDRERSKSFDFAIYNTNDVQPDDSGTVHQDIFLVFAFQHLEDGNLTEHNVKIWLARNTFARSDSPPQVTQRKFYDDSPA